MQRPVNDVRAARPQTTDYTFNESRSYHVKESILLVRPVPPRTKAVERPRREVAVNQITALWDSMIGKKVVMATTGAVLVLFVIMHMIGNLKILSGPDN